MAQLLRIMSSTMKDQGPIMIPRGPKAASLRKKTFQRLWNKTSLIVSGEETIFTEGWASGIVWGEQSHAFPKSDFISFHTHGQRIIMHIILIWRKNVAAKIPIKSNGEKFCVWHSATLSAGNCWSWLQKFLIEQRLASSPSPALSASPLSFPSSQSSSLWIIIMITILPKPKYDITS